MPHALLIAVIFVPYVLLMIGIGFHLWCQVGRHHDAGELDDVRQAQVEDGTEEEEPPEPARCDVRLIA